MKLLRILTIALALLGCGRAAEIDTRRPPNVLFIAVDDLRSDLGVLGVNHAKTPNLDRFAGTARLFTHHYTQVPTCGASRCALLRGRYPTEQVHLDNNAIAATHASWGGVHLPGWLQNHGYRTFAMGKITHYPGGRTGRDWTEGPVELPGAWERCWIPESPWKTAQSMMHGYANGAPRTPGSTPPWQAFAGPDTAYPDAWVAEEAMTTLRTLTASDRPWFFAVGFFKPHLPFAAPQQYFDRHDPDKIPAPPRAPHPETAISWHASKEFRGNYGHGGLDPEKDPGYARQLRQAYAASVSYVDAQIGRVLDALTALHLDDRTIVVLWSDHGFLLGEHAIWGKHCLFEGALRSPLMIRVPGLKKPGAPSSAIVEAVDIFPTLLELAALPQPAGLDGRSLAAQLADPAAPTTKPALGFWTGGQRTVRTDRWRLIVRESTSASEQRQVELYDDRSSVDELRNEADSHPETVKQLLAMLPPKLQ